MKTLIISSSLSPESKSFILCEAISNILEKVQSTDQSPAIEVDLVDAREMELTPCHLESTQSMRELTKKITESDNIIIGMGVHCYSINDGLKIILDNCFKGAEGKFFGIICAAGGERSYLSTVHLTQICMNEWRMIQLPRIIYATGKDFNTKNMIVNKDIRKRLNKFCNEFISIGKKLIS